MRTRGALQSSRAEQFREHAANCLRLAAVAQDEQARAMLVHLAEAWVRLAAATPADPMLTCTGTGLQEKMSESNGSEER